MDSIRCSGCSRDVVPRLWHYSPLFGGYIRYMITQHICPLCGVVMYETGGQLYPLVKYIFWLLAIYAYFALVGVLLSSVGSGNLMAKLFSELIGVASIVIPAVYLWKRFANRKRKG